MNFAYHLTIYIYTFLIRLVSPFNHKAALFVKGRKNWKKKLAAEVGNGGRFIWFHCASLGEFEQGRPVIEEVKKRYPEYKIILTFFSPSGYEVRKNYTVADIVSYLPMDTPNNARLFLDMVKPEKIFFIKYEYWVNYMAEARERNIPFYIISSIFRAEQVFFKNHFVGIWFRKSLKSITRFFVQDEDSVRLLAKYGFENATISGDTRFDRVAAIAETVKKFADFEAFKAGQPLLVVGSSWQPDEEIVIKYINHSENEKFIIAPHEVSAANLKRIKAALQKPAGYYSEIDKSKISEYDVIIIDSVGMLSSLYQYGDVAYIGGGFGVGIHNILEASTFGLPVVFGPNYKKFREADDLVSMGAAFSVYNFDQAQKILKTLLSDSEKRNRLSLVAKKYIKNNLGATQIILKNTFGK